MNVEYVDAIGYGAAILTTLAFLPQAFKVLRTRQTRDISLLWAIAMSAGVFLWLCYGYASGSMPMIVANAITLALLLAILGCKLYCK